MIAHLIIAHLINCIHIKRPFPLFEYGILILKSVRSLFFFFKKTNSHEQVGLCVGCKADLRADAVQHYNLSILASPWELRDAALCKQEQI